MMLHPLPSTPFLDISDCESHGHCITLSVFQLTGAAAQITPRGGLVKDILQKGKRTECAPIRSHGRGTSSSHSPDNCTKPIKEDTVAFHAA